MKFNKNLFWAVALLGLIAGCKKEGGSMAEGTTGGGGGSEALTLKLNPKEGETYRYTIDVDGGGQNMGMKMSMAAVEIKDDKITIKSAVDDMTIGGKPAPAEILTMMKAVSTTTVMDRNGKVISSKTDGGPAGQGPTSTPGGLALPDKALKVGDTWDGESDVSGKKVKATYKYVGVEDVDGKKAAKIEVSFPVDAGMKLTKPMVNWIEIETGMPLKMEMEGESDGKPMKMKMNRV